MSSQIGDMLWWLYRLCPHLGVKMSEVAAGNIEKILSRQARGLISGDGDDR